MELTEILQHVEKYETPQRRALALAYYADYLAGLVRSEALYFRTEWANNYLDISGDYVSDLVAAISPRVEILSGLVAELDKARAELDAASFPVAGA